MKIKKWFGKIASKTKELFDKVAEKLKFIKLKFNELDTKKKILCVAALVLILLLLISLIVWGVHSASSNEPVLGTEQEESKDKNNNNKKDDDDDAIPSDLLSKIPKVLPGNVSYDVLTRVGLESASELSGELKGKYFGASWTEEGAVYGKAFRFACNMTLNDGAGNRGEVNYSLKNPILPENVRGLLYYVDFSGVERDPEKKYGLCSAITLNGNTYRSMIVDGDDDSGIAYYYRNNEWTRTKAVNGDRMSLPDGFAGWVYVPLTSYGGADEIYDSKTGLGLPNIWITDMNLYTDGYKYTMDHYTLYDEILFVTSDEVAFIEGAKETAVTDTAEYRAKIPAKLPGNVSFEVDARLGLDSEEEIGKEITGKFSNGQFTDKGSVYGGAYKFACDMTMNNGKGNRGEVTLHYANSVKVEGSRGVLWYADFSDVKEDTAKAGIGIAVTLGTQTQGTKYNFRAQKEDSVGYYYQNGKWTQTSPAKGYGDRMIVPNGFKGWIYVPFTSYKDAEGLLYDEKTGLGLAEPKIIYTQLFTEGYVYTSDHYTLYDEILFVSSKSVPKLSASASSSTSPTTLPSGLLSKIPGYLPENKLYEVKDRISLDKDTAKATGAKLNNGKWTGAEKGVYGGAFSFASGFQNDTGIVAGEATITPNNSVSLNGVEGVLWYVDFSEVTYSDKMRSEIVLTGKDASGKNFSCRATVGTVRPGTETVAGLGYYYLDGKWTETYAYGGGRMVVPSGFAGWIYVPLSSYAENTAMANGVGIAGATVTTVNLYQLGFEADKAKNITYDEILFVKKTGGTANPSVPSTPSEPSVPSTPSEPTVPSEPETIPSELLNVTPEALPQNALYEVKDRISLDKDTAEATGAKLNNGKWTGTDKGVYGGAFSFASGVNIGTNLVAGEATITPNSNVDLEGAEGILWYVDFSEVTYSDRMRSEIVLTGKDASGKAFSCRATVGTVHPNTTTTTGLGYYYLGGEWNETYSVGGGRMVVPSGFAGWIYVPLSSYASNTAMVNGVGVAGATVTSVSLYQLGFEPNATKNIVYDEILFVKKTGETLIPEEPVNPPVLDDELKAVVPNKMPGGADYELKDRISLNADSATASGNKLANAVWTDSTEGICAGAFKFASGVVVQGTATAGEAMITPNTAANLEGTRGILWYVDLSEVEKDTTKNTGYSVSVALDCSVDGNSVTYVIDANEGVGYYYKDGKWTKASAIQESHIRVPDQFVGWVYVPLTSYISKIGDGDIYDLNGIGAANVTVTAVNVTADGYVYETAKNVKFDEILFVKTDAIEIVDVTSVAPAKLPDNEDLTSFSNYDIKARVGMENGEAIGIIGTKYWGGITPNFGIFGDALKFTSGIVAGASGATTAKDPSTYTGTETLVAGECTVTPNTPIDISGAKGVLWYADFSGVTRNTNYGYGLCSSITLNGKVGDTVFSQRSLLKDGGGQAYYYWQNAEGQYEWVATTAAASSSCRIKVPDGFKGWIYVPFTSYVPASTRYPLAFIGTDGKAVENAIVRSMGLYSLGYVPKSDTNIIWDEILFVQ